MILQYLDSHEIFLSPLAKRMSLDDGFSEQRCVDRAPANIEDVELCNNIECLKVVYYSCKTLHLRCLTALTTCFFERHVLMKVNHENILKGMTAKFS